MPHFSFTNVLKKGRWALMKTKGEKKHDVSAALLAPLFCWEQLHLSPVWEFQKHLHSHTQNIQTLRDPVKLTYKINHQSVYRSNQPWWQGRKIFWTHQTPLVNTPKSQLRTTTTDEKGRKSPEKTYNWRRNHSETGKSGGPVTQPNPNPQEGDPHAALLPQEWGVWVPPRGSQPAGPVPGRWAPRARGFEG